MKTVNNLIPPMIHLNGTSGMDLLDEQMNACQAVEEAIVALAHATPNARDFYVQQEGAYTVALEQHRARLTKLNQVLSELQEIEESIAEQQAARTHR